MRRTEERPDYKRVLDEEFQRFKDAEIKKYGGKKEMIVKELLEDNADEELEPEEIINATLAKEQKEVAEIIEEDLEIKLGKVKGKKLVKITRIKVDVEELGKIAATLLQDLAKQIDCSGVEIKFIPTNAGYLSYKVGNKIVFGIRYSVKNGLVLFFVISEIDYEQYKNLTKGNEYGKYSTADFQFDGENITKFISIAGLSIKKYKKQEPKLIEKTEKIEVKPKVAKVRKAYFPGTATEQKLARLAEVKKLKPTSGSRKEGGKTI